MQCIVSCCLRFAAVLVIAREGIVVAKNAIVVAKNETTTVEVAAIIVIAAKESATTAWQDQSAEHLDYSNLLSLVLLSQSAENFNFVATTSSSVVITEVSCSTFIV